MSFLHLRRSRCANLPQSSALQRARSAGSCSHCAWQKQECCSEPSVAPSSHKTPNYWGGEGYISKFVAEIITRNLSHTLKRLSLCHVLQLLDVFSPILVIRSLKNTANNRRSFHLCSQEGKYADKGHNKKADTQFVCFQRSLRKNVLHKGSPWLSLPETIPAGMRLQPFLICCF